MVGVSSHAIGERALSAQEIEFYHRNGWLRIPRLFDVDELEPLGRAYREDPTINGGLYGMVDDAGEPHPICIWTELSNDMIGTIPRMARVVEASEALLGEACYHWHSKLTVKPARCRARVDWHQDFASWYDDGVLFPRMLTAAIALDPATRANGCMQVIPCSHRMGRIDHRTGSRGIDSFSPRLERAKELLGVVHCELDVGDALFFHCNLLHGSSTNETDTTRLLLFPSYNAVSNPPVAGAQGPNEEGAFMNISAAERALRPLQKLPDDVLRMGRYESAFHHTRFKSPCLEPREDYTRAVQLDPHG